MEYNNGKILRLFRMKENKVPVRDFTNNNFVPVPGKAVTSDTGKDTSATSCAKVYEVAGPYGIWKDKEVTTSPH